MKQTHTVGRMQSYYSYVKARGIGFKLLINGQCHKPSEDSIRGHFTSSYLIANNNNMASLRSPELGVTVGSHQSEYVNTCE
jgi:hypothetical protein